VHAIWINPHNSNHVIIGNDGGLAQSWDQAKTWVFIPNLPVGLFYHVSWTSRRRTTSAAACRTTTTGAARARCAAPPASPGFNWETIQGGDGFVVLQDPRDNRVIYSESQDGNIVRVDRVTGETISIARARTGPAGVRFQWDTPIVILAARSGDGLIGRQDKC
jgi:hypothetical protein